MRAAAEEELLSEEELTFLLDDYKAPVDGPADRGFSEKEEAQWAVIGDLSRMPLSEFLLERQHTECVLSVTNPVETHHLYIKDGGVRDLVPQRVEGRRIGKRLVRSGAITEAQLEQALARHRNSSKPLGQMLVEERLIDEELLLSHVSSQDVEDLYSLFTWKQGVVSVCDGPPSAELRPLFAGLPRAPIREVLAEAERRAPEWDRVLQTLNGLEGVFKKVKGPIAGRDSLTVKHAAVLGALEGAQSLRDLSDSTMLGLFDCARAVKELVDSELIETARPEEQLAIARARITAGDVNAGVVLLRAIVAQQDVHEPAFARDLAELLQRCGESRLASSVLVHALSACTSDREALDIARRAFSLDTRSADAARSLHGLLCGSQDGSDELVEVTAALADILIGRGSFEEALELVTPLASPSREGTPLFGRRIRLLRKLDRPNEAVEELLSLAEIYRARGRRDRLATVYEHVLRIDGSRTDIARRLRILKRPRLGKRGRLLGLAGLLVVGAGIAWWVYSNQQRGQRYQALLSSVHAELDKGDGRAALTLLNRDTEFDGDPAIDKLRWRGDQLVADQERAVRAKREAMLRRLASAADSLGRGDVVSALQIYGELLGDAATPDEVERVALNRLTPIEKRLDDRANGRLGQLPAEPNGLAETSESIAAALGILDRDFPEDDHRLAKSVLAARSDPTLLHLIGAERTSEMVAVAEQVVEVFSIVEQRRAAYTMLQRQAETKQRLAPVWKRAEQLEKDRRFRQAHTLYAQLAREYPLSDDGLRDHFLERATHYESVVRHLDAIADATESGDFAAARDHLGALAELAPEVPFASMVVLPLSVQSLPAGATVYVDGDDVGVTPLTVARRPAAETVVEFALDGFSSERVTVVGDTVNAIRALLRRHSNWTVQTPGIVESAPVFSSDGASDGLAVVTDRTGTLTAIDIASGGIAWSHETGDLSGLLPTPVLWQDKLICASLDGPLRALVRRTAQEAWTRDGIYSELAPVIAGGLLVLATPDGNLVGVDPATGEPRYSVDLPSPARFDPVATGGTVIVITADDDVVALSATDGAEVWRVHPGTLLRAPAVATDSGVIVAATDGRVMHLGVTDGASLWEASGLGKQRWPAAIVGDRVVVATPTGLARLDLADGQLVDRQPWTAQWASPPVLVGSSVVVGDVKGVVAVFAADTLDLRFILRGEDSVSAPPAAVGAAGVLVPFADRSVSYYRLN